MAPVPADDLRLRPLRPHDRDAALRAHEALQADHFTFLFDHRPDEPWIGYLKRIDDQCRGRDLPADRVQATFLVACVKDDLVGRVSVRHHLNTYLSRYGGHIGYGVVPWQRRKGYATEILRQALIIARSVGVDRVLVTCDDSNLPSAKTIEACGGRLDSVITEPGVEEPIRRYWIS